MKNRVKIFGREEGGLAAVEFALLAPFLVLLLAGMVDFGVFINKKMQTENLARSAAEYVVKGGSEANVEADVLMASGLTDQDLQSISMTSATTCECSNGQVTTCGSSCGGDGYQRSFYSFTMNRVYTPIFPYPGIPDEVTLTGNARLQVQ